MTTRRTDGPTPAADDARAAATRRAKGSVQEAIGTLMGDDAARERGAAEKEAGAADAAGIEKSPRP